jgi:hypothetical protein
VYGVITQFYNRLYCLVLKQAETFLNEKQPNVRRQWCPAITVCLLVFFKPVCPILDILHIVKDATITLINIFY